MTGVEVTQADRDAVFSYWNHPAERRVVPITAVSDDHALVQAFARHRHEARSAALEEAAKVAEQAGELSNYSGRGSCCQGLGEDIATAIRSLSRRGGA